MAGRGGRAGPQRVFVASYDKPRTAARPASTESNVLRIGLQGRSVFVLSHCAWELIEKLQCLCSHVNDCGVPFIVACNGITRRTACRSNEGSERAT